MLLYQAFSKIFTYLFCLLISVFIFLGLNSTGYCADYLQISGVMHVHSNISSGKYSIEKIAQIAKENGISVVILTDHDKVRLEYGILPFRNILKKVEERPSVLKYGIEKYFKEIEGINKKHKDVLFIPGVQSSPFYYWTGNPLKKILTCHLYRKELLVLGLKPEAYKKLPTLYNGFSTRYVKKLLPGCLPFLGLLFLSFVPIYWGGIYRVIGILMFLLSLLGIIDTHPFKLSPFDPYHGNQGEAPYQEFINYVNEKGGLVFWAHPESRYSIRGKKYGPVILKTPLYPQSLLNTYNYTGFAALYGDYITAINPGNYWDMCLKEYCLGKKKRAVWGYSEADFHGEEPFSMFQTMFLIREKNQEEIIFALKKGRFYAIFTPDEKKKLILNEFYITNEEGTKIAILGEEISLKGKPYIHIGIDYPESTQLKVRLIRYGEVIKEWESYTPFNVCYKDDFYKKDVKTFYRIDVKTKKAGRLVSNPIFVSFK